MAEDTTASVTRAELKAELTEVRARLAAIEERLYRIGEQKHDRETRVLTASRELAT